MGHTKRGNLTIKIQSTCRFCVCYSLTLLWCSLMTHSKNNHIWWSHPLNANSWLLFPKFHRWSLLIVHQPFSTNHSHHSCLWWLLVIVLVGDVITTLLGHCWWKQPLLVCYIFRLFLLVIVRYHQQTTAQPVSPIPLANHQQPMFTDHVHNSIIFTMTTNHYFQLLFPTTTSNSTTTSNHPNQPTHGVPHGVPHGAVACTTGWSSQLRSCGRCE